MSKLTPGQSCVLDYLKTYKMSERNRRAVQKSCGFKTMKKFDSALKKLIKRKLVKCSEYV